MLPVSGRTLHIAAGFCTDGASIPRLLWTLFDDPFDPEVVAPALAHDALYAAELLSRRDCDDEFFSLLIDNGNSAGFAWSAWSGVRLGGWWVWYFDHNAKSIAQARELCALDAPPALSRQPSVFSMPLGWAALDGAGNAAAFKAIHAHVAANPVCKWCGNTKIGELTAHHILPVHLDPKLASDDANLITLCHDGCHIVVGHYRNFQHINPHSREICEQFGHPPGQS